MGRLFKIRLNRAQLRENLSREHGHPVSDPEIDRWLVDAGFTASAEHWIVREEDLGHLQSEEVSEAEIIGPDESESAGSSTEPPPA
jgi:hypothetical protein